MRAINPILRCTRFLVVALLLGGCAQTTQINAEPGVSLADYHMVEIGKVTNDTGETYSYDVTGFFHDQLEHALTTKGYTVAESGEATGKVLLVNCRITSYSAGGTDKRLAAAAMGLAPGGYSTTPTDSATIKSTLIDLKSGRIVADLVSAPSRTESAVPQTSFGNRHDVSMISSQKRMVKEAAWDLASQIDNRIKSQQ